MAEFTIKVSGENITQVNGESTNININSSDAVTLLKDTLGKRVVGEAVAQRPRGPSEYIDGRGISELKPESDPIYQGQTNLNYGVVGQALAQAQAPAQAFAQAPAQAPAQALNQQPPKFVYVQSEEDKAKQLERQKKKSQMIQQNITIAVVNVA